MSISILTLLPLLTGQVIGCQSPSAIAVVVAPVETVTAIKLSADTATMTGSSLQQKIPGYTGKGYAGDFIPDGARSKSVRHCCRRCARRNRDGYQTVGGHGDHDWE